MKMITLIATVLLAALLLSNTGATAVQTGWYVWVDAGQSDRHNTVVSFQYDPKGRRVHLEDVKKTYIPLQFDGTTASFVLRDLKAGESEHLRIMDDTKKSLPVTGGVELTRVQNRLEIKIRGKQVFSFVAEPGSLPSPDIKPVFLRGGYIHPVYTPKGKIVTDDYPSDHYHHHGIWFAWTKTEFEGKHPDFWNVGDGTGRVDFEKVGKTLSGPVYAEFTSFQKYVALTGETPKTVLNEDWDVRVYNVGSEPYYVFDIVATQECASASPLILEEYRYGGMGVRGNREWKDKTKVSFLTSEGKTRDDGNATRGRWCHIGGTVDGQLVGIAVLDHPSNFRAPEPLRIHPDDPYFNYAPSQMGRFQIDPGKKYVMRYRFVVSDGPPDAKLLDRLWKDYANPPKAQVAGM